MKRKSELIGSLLAFFIIGGLIAIPAQADKPGWAGGDKGGGNIEQPGKGHGEKDNRHSENAKGRPCSLSRPPSSGRDWYQIG